MIGYGCVSANPDKLARNVLPWVAKRGRPLMAVFGAPSMSAGCNRVLDAYDGMGLDALILLHDDLKILDPEAEEKFLAAFDDDVALVGVAGGKGRTSLYWWESEKVGHQYTDSGLLDFGPRAGDVAILEGSIMVLTPWAIEHLRFDERYPDFRSGYDDVCVTALEKGMRNVVVDVATAHHTTVGWKSPEIEAAFAQSEAIFREKWKIT